MRHGGRAAAAFAGRLERFGDIGLHHQLDVAGDLAAGAREDGEHGSRLRNAVAMGVPWRVRQRQSSSCASCSATCNPLSPSAASVPAAPPNCSASASLRRRFNRLRERCKAAAYSASFSPNGIGSACCSQVRATTAVLRCCSCQLRKAGDRAVDIRKQRVDAARKVSIVAVSITSWLVAPQCT